LFSDRRKEEVAQPEGRTGYGGGIWDRLYGKEGTEIHQGTRKLNLKNTAKKCVRSAKGRKMKLREGGKRGG